MRIQPARTWAEIHTAALIHNLKYGMTVTGKPVMCVIKGDAHGHGAVECGKILEANGASAFAVACLSEAIALRQGGITVPILILGWTPAEDAAVLSRYDLTQSVFDLDYGRKLNDSAKSPVSVHIKLDTGMSRTGLPAQENPKSAASAVLEIDGMQNLNITGIFTHFAAADMEEKDAFTSWQLSNFQAVLSELKALGFAKPIIRHAANSAGILYHPETHFDMVRMGVMMYGLYPDGKITPDGPLKPVLTLKSRVAQVKDLPAGALISYGCTYRAEAPITVAVVTAGYADAYPRALTNQGAWAVINGQKCPQIGRVCMDLCMFDVTGANVKQGDEVILYGAGGMSMEEVASLAATINCEPLSLLTRRVEKIYI